MIVGDSIWRFVYDGDDVVAEFVDENGNDEIDRVRYYWLLPNIDQRIGFVDAVEVNEVMQYTYYYYLTDQVGSVIAVVDSQGNIVNQYDYDAFGNLNGQDSFETVENRYRFHGREYDSHRGEYYYRYRNYIPEWGQFASPDMMLDATEPEGACNYVFCGNDATIFIDPLGLYWWEKKVGTDDWIETLVDVFTPVGIFSEKGRSTNRGFRQGLRQSQRDASEGAIEIVCEIGYRVADQANMATEITTGRRLYEDDLSAAANALTSGEISPRDYYIRTGGNIVTFGTYAKGRR